MCIKTWFYIIEFNFMWPLLSRNWFSLLIFRVTLSGRQRDRRSAWRSGLAPRVVLRCYHSRASGQPYSECCTFSVFMFHLLEKQPLSRIHFPSEGSSPWFLHRISLRTSLTLAKLWKTNHKLFFFFYCFVTYLYSSFLPLFILNLLFDFIFHLSMVSGPPLHSWSSFTLSCPGSPGTTCLLLLIF